MTSISSAPHREHIFGFFITEGFSLPAYTSLAETFRIANDITGQTLFRWYTVAATQDLIPSASGLWIQPDLDIQTKIRFHQMAVVSSLNSHNYQNKQVFQWLKHLDHQGCALGAITSGSWILAKAKLLTGYRCTLHWTELEAFRETYPQLNATDTLYEIDRGRFSAASGFAALDMVLHMIVTQYGYEFASKINARLVAEGLRSGERQQRLYQHIQNLTVKRAITIMEDHIEMPLSLEDIAAKSSISTRQLTRLFQQHIGISPQQHYLAMRLDRAAALLRQTDFSITQIAIATGFENLSHFSIAFKKHLLQAPSQFRKQLRGSSV